MTQGNGGQGRAGQAQGALCELQRRRLQGADPYPTRRGRRLVCRGWFVWDALPNAGYAKGRAEIQAVFEKFQAVKFIVHYVTNPLI